MKDVFISNPRGAAASIWNVPHLRNPHFTGREDELARLRDSLVEDEGAVLVAAHTFPEPGGVGKTQIAVEYAYRNRADYDVVWWVRSEEPTTLASDFAALAARLDLPEKDTPEQQLIVEEVRVWLLENPRWLLVFDNAPDMLSLCDFFWRGGAGHVIITSRNRNFLGARMLSVETLPPEKAIEFLLKRTGQQDETSASRLAEALGCLPLALEQAGAYICQQGCTIEYYLNLYDIHKYETIAQGRQSTEHPETVAATVAISLQQIESDNAAAVELLRLCSFFAPDDIPVKMLLEASYQLPESLEMTAIDDLLRAEALVELSNYSLIELHDETISIHRLVQALVRAGMNRDARSLWAEIAVYLVSVSFPARSMDARMWPACASLLAHGFVSLSRADECQVLATGAGRLLNLIGTYLNARMDLARSKALYELARAAYEATPDGNPRNKAIVLSNLGFVAKQQGDLADAMAFYEDAVAIEEEDCEPDDPHLPAYLVALADLLKEQGDLDRAKHVLARALELVEKVQGADSPHVGVVGSRLADVLKELGDLDEAKTLYECILMIDEAALGPDHPRVANDLQKLGLVLIQLEAYADAKALFERGLAINEAAFGPDDLTIAIFASGIGWASRELGDLESAKAFHRRALAITEALLGPDHRNVTMILNDLAVVLRDEGNLNDAEPLLERALAIDEATFGSDDPRVALRLNNLGNLLRELGDLDEALSILEKARDIYEASFGPEHQTVALAMSNISAVLRDQGDLAGARKLLERVVALNEARLGPGHPHFAIDLNNMGWLLIDEGDPVGGRALVERALLMLRENLGENHPDTRAIERKLKFFDKKPKSESDESS